MAGDIADRRPNGLSEKVSHPSGCGASGQTSGLEHENPAGDGVEQAYRDHSGLARTRRRDQDRHTIGLQRRADLVDDRFDGQAGGIHDPAE
ncbi:hypothetical protein BH23ACT5_BH23ACT5_00990 [soil metagenome]